MVNSAKKGKTGGNKAAPVQASVKAGLKFPIARIGRMMRRDRLANSVGRSSMVVMTAVLEYIASEILELSGSISLRHKKKRIVPRHIMLAIGEDDELSKLCASAIFSESGSIVKINPALMPNNKKGAKVG